MHVLKQEELKWFCSKFTKIGLFRRKWRTVPFFFEKEPGSSDFPDDLQQITDDFLRLSVTSANDWFSQSVEFQIIIPVLLYKSESPNAEEVTSQSLKVYESGRKNHFHLPHRSIALGTSPASEQSYSLLWKKPGKQQIHLNAEKLSLLIVRNVNCQNMVSPHKSLLQIRYRFLTEFQASRDSVQIRPCIWTQPSLYLFHPKAIQNSRNGYFQEKNQMVTPKLEPRTNTITRHSKWCTLYHSDTVVSDIDDMWYCSYYVSQLMGQRCTPALKQKLIQTSNLSWFIFDSLSDLATMIKPKENAI